MTMLTALVNWVLIVGGITVMMISLSEGDPLKAFLAVGFVILGFSLLSED